MEDIKKSVATVTGVITSLFGWMGWLAILYCIAMAVDYCTGTAVALKEKNWSSAAARAGLWKKCGSVVAVFVAGITDLLLNLVINNLPTVNLPFNYSVLLCPIVLIWYILTEMGSIIENAAKMGAPIPPFLKKYLSVLKKTVESDSDESVK